MDDAEKKQSPEETPEKGALEKLGDGRKGLVANLVACATAAITLKAALGLDATQTSILVAGIAILSLGGHIAHLLSAAPSRIKDVDKYEKFISGSTCFTGRVKEIDDLRPLIANKTFVKLTGDSGVGKSTLLKFGIASAWDNAAAPYPIYVESLGDSFVDGPIESLFNAIRQSFAKKLPKEEGASIDDLLNKEQTFEFLAEFQTKYGRRPIVILDQLDHYQREHPTKFITRRGPYRNAKVILRVNPFWKKLFELVETRHVHLVVATTADYAEAARSVEALPPVPYPLGGISKSIVGPLLNKLEKFIENPNGKWSRLRLRLEEHLSETDTLHPFALVCALRGLSCLPKRNLTVSAYNANGELRGLEAVYIEDKLAKSSTLKLPSGKRANRNSLLQLLKVLATPEDKGKAAFLTDDQIATAVELVPDDSKEVLADLRRHQILRPENRLIERVRTQVWLLYHDGLADIVHEAVRRTNVALSDLTKRASNWNAARWYEKPTQLIWPWSICWLVWRRYRDRASGWKYGKLKNLIWINIAIHLTAFASLIGITYGLCVYSTLCDRAEIEKLPLTRVAPHVEGKQYFSWVGMPLRHEWLRREMHKQNSDKTGANYAIALCALNSGNDYTANVLFKNCTTANAEEIEPLTNWLLKTAPEKHEELWGVLGSQKDSDDQRLKAALSLSVAKRLKEKAAQEKEVQETAAKKEGKDEAKEKEAREKAAKEKAEKEKAEREKQAHKWRPFAKFIAGHAAEYISRSPGDLGALADCLRPNREYFVDELKKVVNDNQRKPVVRKNAVLILVEMQDIDKSIEILLSMDDPELFRATLVQIEELQPDKIKLAIDRANTSEPSQLANSVAIRVRMLMQSSTPENIEAARTLLADNLKRQFADLTKKGDISTKGGDPTKRVRLILTLAAIVPASKLALLIDKSSEESQAGIVMAIGQSDERIDDTELDQIIKIGKKTGDSELASSVYWLSVGRDRGKTYGTIVSDGQLKAEIAKRLREHSNDGFIPKANDLPKIKDALTSLRQTESKSDLRKKQLDGHIYDNSLGLTMVLVDGGNMLFGTPVREPYDKLDEAFDDEHSVEPFEISAFEVTVELYSQFLKEEHDKEYRKKKPRSHEMHMLSPATAVNWFGAAEFCNWLNKKEGVPVSHWVYEPNDKDEYGPGMKVLVGKGRDGYRLPKWDEWECACRAGTLTRWSCGESPRDLERYSCFWNNSYETQWPVASKMPNQFGIFDMHGNSDEWCHERCVREKPDDEESLYHEIPFTEDTTISETDYFGARGGEFYFRDLLVRSSQRRPHKVTDKFNGFIGIRVARSQPVSGSQPVNAPSPAKP